MAPLGWPSHRKSDWITPDCAGGAGELVDVGSGLGSVDGVGTSVDVGTGATPPQHTSSQLRPVTRKLTGGSLRRAGALRLSAAFAREALRAVAARGDGDGVQTKERDDEHRGRKNALHVEINL